MHHCVGGYANRCVEGRSIIFSMRKGERGYVTIELDGTSLPYHIHQKYSISDTYVTNETVLELINKWLEDTNELHREDTTPYNQGCKNVVDTLIAKSKLKKLKGLKEKAGEDTLAHINNECDKLEQQLAALAMETTQVPLPNANTEMNILEVINE